MHRSLHSAFSISLCLIASGCLGTTADIQQLESTATDVANEEQRGGCDTLPERLRRERRCAGTISYTTLQRGQPEPYDLYRNSSQAFTLRRGSSHGVDDAGECRAVVFQAVNLRLDYQLASADSHAQPHAHHLARVDDGWRYDTALVGADVSVHYEIGDVVVICAGRGDAASSPVMVQIWGE